MPRRKALGTRTISLVLVAIVLIAATGVLLTVNRMNFSGSDKVTSSETVQPTNTSTTATNPTNELELRLSVNASQVNATSVGVSLLVDAYNPSSSVANVTSSNDWVIPLTGSDGAPCGDDTYAETPTVGFAMAEGHYTSANVTAANLLDLVNPSATYNCGLYLGYADPTGFLFQPMSDMATAYGCNPGLPDCMTGSASTGLSASSWPPISGYWSQGGTFISFPKGVYTVLAEDEWGALAFSYFMIS
jgi:hypothetical protein